MQRFGHLLFPAILAAVVTITCAPPAFSETDDRHLMLPGADEPYPFNARDVSIEDALRLFSRNLRVGITIAEDVDLSARAVFDMNGTRQEYLDEIAALYDFGWYFDGSVLHIFSIGQMQIKVYSLQQTNGSELISMLQTLGVYQKRFFHRADARRQALLVSGPESYIETVTQVVEALEAADTRKITVLRGSGGGASQTIVSEDIDLGALPATDASGS